MGVFPVPCREMFPVHSIDEHRAGKSSWNWTISTHCSPSSAASPYAAGATYRWIKRSNFTKNGRPFPPEPIYADSTLRRKTGKAGPDLNEEQGG